MDRNDKSRIKEILADAGEQLDRIASKLQRYLEFTCESLEVAVIWTSGFA